MACCPGSIRPPRPCASSRYSPSPHAYQEVGAPLEPGLGRHFCLLSDRSSVRPASSPQAQHPPSKQTTYLLREVSLPVTGRLQRSQIPSDLVLLRDTPLLRPAPARPGSNHPRVVSLTPETSTSAQGPRMVKPSTLSQ